MNGGTFVSPKIERGVARAENWMQKQAEQFAAVKREVPCAPWPEIIQRDTLAPRRDLHDDLFREEITIVPEYHPPTEQFVIIRRAGNRFRAFGPKGIPLGDSDHLDNLTARFPDAMISPSVTKQRKRRRVR